MDKVKFLVFFYLVSWHFLIDGQIYQSYVCFVKAKRLGISRQYRIVINLVNKWHQNIKLCSLIDIFTLYLDSIAHAQ